MSQIALIKATLADHHKFWQDLKPRMKQLDAIYCTRFWESTGAKPDGQIRVEVPEGYGFVEGYVASLFPKAPAITVEADAQNPSGNADVVKAVVDRWLYDTAPSIEAGIRQGLIYTHGLFKVATVDSESILDSVVVRAVPPWEVILDRGALTWKQQRYYAHVYDLPVSEAKEKWGDKEFNPKPKEEYLAGERKTGSKTKQADLPAEYLYITVVEFYDFIKGRLLFWSPDCNNGEALLEEVVIPLTSHDGQPLGPIAPLYFVRHPSKPLEGLSSLDRVSDQIREKNIVRSFWANAIRRDARIYMYLKDKGIDEEVMAAITSGKDGVFVGVDGETLDGLIKLLEVNPITSNHDRYLREIEQDLSKGSVMAPFTRGEGQTGATATEIRAQYAYSSSEVGRLAREKDTAINNLSEIYVRTVQLLLEDNSEPPVMTVNRKLVVLQAEMFDGKFKFQSLDMASTPIAQEIKQKQFIGLIPTLAQVGITPDQIRKQLVHLYDDVLPADWADTPEPVPEPEPEASPLGGLPPEAGAEAGPLADALPPVPDNV